MESEGQYRAQGYPRFAELPRPFPAYRGTPDAQDRGSKVDLVLTARGWPRDAGGSHSARRAVNGRRDFGSRVASDRERQERRDRAWNEPRRPIYKRNRVDESGAPSPRNRCTGFPLVVAGVRDQLSEVKKPWFASADDHTNAVAKYLKGEVVEGWERRDDVISRIAQLSLTLDPRRALSS